MLKGIELPRIDTGGFNLRASSSRVGKDAPEDWRGWLQTLFPEHVARGFGENHEEFWEWLWEIEPDSDPAPFIGIWARGGGKSTSAELGAAALGIRRKRKYILYVRDTQERADDSVSNIAALLESVGVGRRLNKYGQSRGWRRNRIRTADGFTVDALGLDVAGRGVKLENQRPDVIIFDDIDGRHDTPKTTEKKIATITESLLPAGTDNVAVIGIQNLIIPNGIFSRLADDRADFLAGRIVSGPHPAIRDLRVEKEVGSKGTIRHVITGGKPTWAGQGLEACQRLLDLIGLLSFMRECQHRTRNPDETIFDRSMWAGKNRYRLDDPEREVVGRWLSLDLAMKDKETSSFNALCVLEISNPGYYLDLRYVWREKMSFPRLLPRIEPMASRWNYDGRLKGLIIEDKAHGITTIQTIEEGSDEWLKGLVIPFDPRGLPKEQRWEQAAGWGQLDCLRLPLADTPRGDVGDLFAFEEELYGLPGGEYKDWGDSYAQGVIFLEHLVADGLKTRRAYAA